MNLLKVVVADASEGIPIAESLELQIGLAGEKLVGFGAAAKAAIAALTPLAPALFAIGAAIAAIAVIDYFSPEKSFGRMSDSADDAREKLKGTQNEIDSLSEQLDSLNAQIEELEGKGTLSITDQAQLDLLKQQTAELEAQKRIQENLAEIQGDAAAQQAGRVLSANNFRLIEDTQVSRDGYGREYSTNTYRDVDIAEYTKNQYDELQRLIKERAKLREEQSKLTPEFSEWWQEDTQYEKNKKRLQQYEERIQSLSDIVSNNVGIINENYASLFNTDGSVRAGFEDTVAEIDDLFGHMSDGVEIAQEKTASLSDALDTSLREQLKKIQDWDADKLKSEMEEVADGADTADKALKSIVDYALDNDIIPDSSIESVNALISTMEELGYITAQTFEQISSGIDLSETLKTAQTNIANLTTALKEASSATGLTSESIANVKSTFAGLASYDPVKLFERTATGVRLNKEAMEQLNKEYEEGVRSDYDAKIQELKTRYGELVTSIDDSTMSVDEYNAAMSQIQGLEGEIQDVQMLKAQYDALTSSYNAFVNAQSASNDRDAYANIGDSYEKVKELLDNGWSGDSEVTNYLDLMLGENWRSDFSDAYSAFDQLTSKIGGTNYSLMDFFKYDESTKKLTTDGLYNFLDTVKALDDSLVQVDEQGNYSFDWSGRVEEVANLLGTSVENVELMELALRDAGFDIWFDPLNEDINALASNLTQTKDNLEQLKPAALDSVNALREMGYLKDVNFDFSTDSLDDLQTQLDAAKQLLADMTDENGEVDVEFKESGYDDLVTIIQTLMNQKHQIEQPVIMRIDTSNASSDVMSLIGLLQDFWSLSSQRHDMLEVNANADTSDVDAKIDGVLSKIKEVPDEVRSQVIVDDSQLTALSAAIDQLTSTDDSGNKIQVSAQIREDSITSIETAINSIEAKDVTVATNSDDVIDELNKVDAYNFKVKQLTVNFPGYSARQRELDNLRSSLNGLKDRSVTITTNRVTRTTTIGGGGARVSGTAHAGGTAFARGSVYGRAYKGGSWRAGVRGESLGGELGPELRVRDGLWELIGRDSAEFFDVRPNDIIFNAEQTRQLLKSGKIANGAKRGMAYADGTVGGFAFSGYGSGRRNNKSSTASASKKGGSNKSSGGSNRSGSSGGSSGRSGDSDSTALDAFKEWFSALFDWIEIRLERMTDKIASYERTAEIHLGDRNYSGANNSYIAALKETFKLSDTEHVAYQKYSEQANSVLRKATGNGIISSNAANVIKRGVANGTIKISEYSDAVQEVIKSYQQWYDKALDAKKAIGDLHSNVREYISDLKQVRDTQRDTSVDNRKLTQDVTTSWFAFRNTSKNNQLSYSNSYLTKVNADYAQAVTNVGADFNNIRKSANSKINSSIRSKDARNKKNSSYKKALQNAQKAIKKNAIVSGSDMNIIRKFSLSTYESLYAYNLQINSLETARIEYATNYASNHAEWYQNIADTYKNDNDYSYDQIALYKQQSSNSFDTEAKNSLLDLAAKQYDAVVSNNDAQIKRYNGHIVGQSQIILTGSWSGGQYNVLNNNTKKNVQKVVNDARNFAKNGKPISSNTIATITYYYKKGYISQKFFIACINYNNAIEYKAQAEIQAEIDKQTVIAEKAALGTERLSNVQKEYENSQRSNVQIGLDKATSAQNLKKARSQDLSEQDYRDLISYNAKEATIWANAQKATQEIIDDNLKMGYWTTTSREYLDAVAAVAEYGVKVDEANTTIEGLKDSLRDDVYWRTFERAHDAAQCLANILSGINDLIDDNSLFDKSGGLTDFGAARIAMLTKELANARSEVKNYSNDIANLNKLYSDGQYTEQEYKEKLNDIQTELLKSASSAKSYTDSLVDMYKQMAKAELDMLLDVIQARQDALKSKKDYYDYDKELRSQTNDVQALQAQLAALEGIDTAEAKARMAKLSAELSDKQEDLDDMLRDHAFDLSNEALNKLKDTLQDAFDDKWDHISGDLSSITELISASNDLSATSAKDIQATLNKLLNFYGVDPVPTGVSASYASGTKKTPRGLIARTNENGPEIIVRKDGIITPLPAGSGVVPSNLTEKLYQMAEDYNPHASAAAHYVGMPKIESGAIGQTVVHQHYDSLINIEGSADAATVEDLKRMKADLLDESYKYTSQKIHSGYVKAGGVRKV